MNLIWMLKLASFSYLGLVFAGLLMPRCVELPRHLAPLPPFIRQLFWVYYTFIGFCLVGFGLMTFFLAEHLASGTPLARSVCGFLALFWILRFAVGTYVFDLRPYLTNDWRRTGLWVIQIIFGVLPCIYVWAALKGGKG